MARILTLDAALPSGSAGLVVDGVVVAERHDAASGLASMVEALLEEGGGFDLVAATVGPGSFTGLRAALALGHGLALAAGVAIVGVTVGAALGDLAPPGRVLWTAIDSKRGRIFLERDGTVQSLPLTALPAPAWPISVAGDAAAAVVARLAARNADVQLLSARRPSPLGIARAVARGQTRPPQPLYVDPPAAQPGPGGRPAPT